MPSQLINTVFTTVGYCNEWSYGSGLSTRVETGPLRQFASRVSTFRSVRYPIRFWTAVPEYWTSTLGVSATTRPTPRYVEGYEPYFGYHNAAAIYISVPGVNRLFNILVSYGRG